MTADVNITSNIKLLPLPVSLSVLLNNTGIAAVNNYTRANVLHHTAAKDAELVELRSTIEALRADVASSKSQSMHNLALVERLLAAKRIDHAAAVDRMLQAEARAEKLAGFLRKAMSELEAREADCENIDWLPWWNDARAALDQEK